MTIDPPKPEAALVNSSTLVLQPAPGATAVPGDHTYENKVSVTIHARWVTFGQGTPAPDKCAVKVSTHGEAWASTRIPNTIGVSDLNLNTGFYDSPVSFSLSGEYAGQGIKANGLHLIQIKGSGGDRTKSFNLSAKVKMSSSGLAQNMAQIVFGVSPDSRSVLLQRGGANGETVDNDGTLHGDTTRSFSLFHSPAPGDDLGTTAQIWNWQQFAAALSGGWSIAHDPFGLQPDHPKVSFQWNPSFSQATLTWNQWSQRFGRQDLVDNTWKGSSGAPEPEPLTYTVTDLHDGAKADATYVLTRHDHMELKEEHEKIQFGAPVKVSDGVVKNSPGQEVTLICNQSVAVGGKVTFNDFLNNPIFDSFFASIKAINLEINSTVTTQLGYSIKVTDLQVHQYTGLEVVAINQRHGGTINQWQEGGYLGLGTFDLSEPAVPYIAYQVHVPYEPAP